MPLRRGGSWRDSLVARRHSAEFLELAEEVFDQIPPFVHLKVAIDVVSSSRFRRDDGDGAAIVVLGAQPIVVKRRETERSDMSAHGLLDRGVKAGAGRRATLYLG